MTNKSKINDLLQLFDISVPATLDNLDEKDYIYLFGRLDSLKHTIMMFGNDPKLLQKWQELADFLSYEKYEYSFTKK